MTVGQDSLLTAALADGREVELLIGCGGIRLTGTVVGLSKAEIALRTSKGKAAFIDRAQVDVVVG